MFITSRLPSLARVATLSLTLVIPAMGLAGTAYADDEYGTGHERLVQQAARSAPSVGDAFALATGRAAQPAAIAGNSGTSRPSVASDAAAPTMKQDLLGIGGQQDNLAREIYHPGSGTDW